MFLIRVMQTFKEKIGLTNWKIIYILFIVGCMFSFYSLKIATEHFSNLLKFILDNRISWLVVTLAFGGDLIRQLYFEKLSIKSGFIPLLKIILEAATYGLVMESSFVFLNALTCQFWLKTNNYFDIEYFGDFDFLTLAFASIFFLAFTFLDIKDIFVRCWNMVSSKSITPVVREDYQNNS